MAIETPVRPRPMPRLQEPNGPARNIALGAALIATGLLAGFFYAFACAVMPGLASTEDRAFIETMQEINEAVVNPVFFLAFFGTPVLTLVAMIAERRSGTTPAARWILAGLILSTIGLIVTFALNIPLNDELKNAGDPDRIANLAKVRDDFEDPWVAWNIIRTVVCTAALGCLGYALRHRGRTQRSEPISGTE